MISRFSLYQNECDYFINRSNRHESFLQKVHKSTLSSFDEKRYCTNETGNSSWKQ